MKKNALKVITSLALLIYTLVFLLGALVPEMKYVKENLMNVSYRLEGMLYGYTSPEYGVFADISAQDTSRVFEIKKGNVPSSFGEGCDTFYFKGHFNYNIPLNTNLLFRLDDFAMKMLVNGKEVFSFTDSDNPVSFTKSPGVGYVAFVSPGISRTDEVEIYLANYYKHLENYSLRLFFENIYKSSPYYVSSEFSKRSLLDIFTDFSLSFIGVFILLMFVVLYSKGNCYKFLLYLGFFVVFTGLKLVGKHNTAMMFFPLVGTSALLDVTLKYASVIAFTEYLNSILLLKRAKGNLLISWIMKVIYVVSFFLMTFSITEDDDFLLYFIEQIGMVATFALVLLHSWLANRKTITKAGKIILFSGLIYVVSYAVEVSLVGSYYKDNVYVETFGFALFIIGHIFLFRHYIISSVEARAQSRHMEDLAYRDALTKTGNRQGWMEKIRRMNECFITGEVFGIAMFDLNNLKIVNDENGHAKGDEYIQSAAELICKNFKNSPVYRIGGDEFVAVLNSQDCTQTEALREKLEMDCYVYYCSHPENKSFSIATGFAVVDYKKDSSFQAVFKRADEDMYVHKKRLKEQELYERS